jgi:hypothetical protein
MHAVDLIASAIAPEPLPCEPGEGVCCVTGQVTACLPRKHLLGKSFTNLDLLAAPQSDMVGVAAYQALIYKWERMSSWYCDGRTFSRLDRQQVRAMVLAGAYGSRWAGYVTTSYKKHGALRAPVNTGSKRVWLFEMAPVDCSNHDRLLLMWERLNRELRAGIGRSVLESLEPNSFVLKSVGYARWRDFVAWARPLYQGALYQFCAYLLPSIEELKHERATTEIPPAGQDAGIPPTGGAKPTVDRGLFD